MTDTPTPSHAGRGGTPGPASTAASHAWQLRLLGAVEARLGSLLVTRWPSRPAAALLARLALQPDRSHPREELIELLWPGVDLGVGRNRLRQMLSALRSVLEGDGRPAVIDADRQRLRLHAGALVCDAVEFERLARRGMAAAARARYGGELMPGHYDEWVLERRRHLATLAENLAPHEAAPAVGEGFADTPAPLPALWTTAFGLDAPLAALHQQVRTQRLVNLVGPGGCGKTRLALELAHRLQAEAGRARAFDRVVFVPLADCQDDGQAAAALARALRLPEHEPLAQQAAWLGAHRQLLVLDNLEQLPQAGSALLMQLLEQAPALHLLATSRQRSGVPGERVVPLTGLPLPASTGDDGHDNPAVALFTDRALAASPGLQVGPAERADIVALVRQLDGLPLALELAATRVADAGLAALRRRLVPAEPGATASGAHLRLLARPGPRSGHDHRPASLEDVIDWSWQLLDGDARDALAAVGLLAGGCKPADLPALLDWPAARSEAAVDTLLAHALLRWQRDVADLSFDGQPASTPDSARLQAPEPVREFVLQRLPDDRRHTLRQAQVRWLLGWARTLGPSAAPATVQAERDNVAALLRDAPEPVAPVLQLTLALRSHWDNRGMPLFMQDALDATLTRHLATPVAAAGAAALASDVHELLAYVRFEAGLVPAAQAHADAALAHAGADPARRARALVRAAWVTLAAGRSEDQSGAGADALQARLDEALALARQAGDRDAQARALHQLAVLHSHLRHDQVLAERLLADAEALWLQLGDRRKAFARLRNRAQCWHHLGRADEALACFEHCARVAADEGDVIGQIDSLLSLSTLQTQRRQWTAALGSDREALRLAWRHRHRHGLAYALWNPALSLAHLRQPDAAQRLMAFAATFWERHFGPLSTGDRQTVRRVHRLVQAQCGRAAAERLWTDGATMDIASAVALALAEARS